MKEFTREELAAFNGKDSEKIYVAHKGKVYDVSGSKMWTGGIHMKRHSAGNDLTTDIQAAPHEPDVLERYPQVGTLKKETGTDEINVPEFLSALLERIPMLRRHPHPMTVHFPIAFMLATTVFTVLYLLTGIAAFDTTVFHCLGAGVLFSLVAIGTGWYTWWLNYLAKPLRPVKIKKRMSILMFVVAAAAFVMRAAVPDILLNFRGISVIYLILVISVFPLVTVIGWYGAALTFPVEKE
ncbi:MAG: cytochrome b5 domain-containing protein [Desulfobacterales bacterium]|nr:cytochrome b5 domain-containing protein [Desulfobacterales bacterium]